VPHDSGGAHTFPETCPAHAEQTQGQSQRLEASDPVWQVGEGSGLAIALVVRTLVVGVTLFAALPMALVVRDHAVVATFSTASVSFIVLFVVVVLGLAALPQGGWVGQSCGRDFVRLAVGGVKGG
jgi:hypothetical protein